MLQTYVLGIDVGTQGTKAVLFNVEGRALASALAQLPFTASGPGCRGGRSGIPVQNGLPVHQVVCQRGRY